MKFIVLNKNQTISNSSGDNMEKINNLFFRKDQSKIYYFRLVLFYGMSSANDGIAIGILSPYTVLSSNMIFGRQCVPLSTTTEQVRSALSGSISYQPAVSTTSASTASNIIELSGIIGTTSVDSTGGEVSFWMCNDTNNGVLTIQRGSILFYQEVV